MSVLAIHKVVGDTPVPLDADSIYVVRVGTGFDLKVTDSTGSVAHSLNLTAGADGQSVTVHQFTDPVAAEAFAATATPFQITVLI